MRGAGGVIHHGRAIGIDYDAAVSLSVVTAGAAADQEFEGLRVVLELREEVVGQVELDGW